MKQRLVLSLALICSLSFTSLALVGATGGLVGTIKDPKGAVIAGAQVSVRNEATGQSQSVVTDSEGRFKIEGLIPGRYMVNISSPGFKLSQSPVAIEDTKTADLQIKLEVEAVRAEITVQGKSPGGNSDPAYRLLRDARGFDSYTVTNLTLKRDIGVLNFVSGTISFLPPVMQRITMAVFTGKGEFLLTPTVPTERDNLRLLTDKESVNETFEKAVLCFTDGTDQEIARQAQAGSADGRANDVLTEYYNRVRRSTETPRTFTEALMSSGDVENLAAELLASVYNPKRPGVFNACIFGQKFGDLRFQVRPNGALPQLLSPEEVALINVQPGDNKDGILYLAHLDSEYKGGTASSDEDKRVIDATHYRIETTVDGEKLTAITEITFKGLAEGDRVLNFGLLPNLRVTRVTTPEGGEIGFIQENRKEDGAFSVILPEGMIKGREYKVSIQYQGNKVIEDAGGGNFAVGARTSWYPSVNAFSDRATFDLTFRVPGKFLLVGVGKLVKEWKEGDLVASEWVSEIPLAVAGFNYGRFKKKEVTDPTTKYAIEGYATSELPDSLKGLEDSIGGMTPTRLTENAITEAQNAVRVFNQWFGEAPYGRIAITQQPQFNFGQSWPTLVYLPISAFFDSTQRWMMLGQDASRFAAFIQEVTPHEVAHQWWGHMVGWSSYHDQWLSEGFADFSAAVYLQFAEKPDKFLKFWERARDTILEKNQYGRRANDAGPVWMGQRLETPRTGGAYSRIIYPKGGYILHMLRMMMWDTKTGDQDFKALMHDFVKTYLHQNASTEDFKQVVERHMKPVMDLDRNGKMDWFFNNWVYGTAVPRYRLDYTLTPDADGKVMLTGTLKQSEVSERFKMVVPIYLDFDGKIMRLGQAAIVGNSSIELKVPLPKKPKRVLLNSYYDVLAAESTSAQK